MLAVSLGCCKSSQEPLLGPIISDPQARISLLFDHDSAPGRFETWHGWQRPALHELEDGHRGIDIAAPEGALLLAPFSGTVKSVTWRYHDCRDSTGGTPWGSKLEIRTATHAVRYFHMSAIFVVPDQDVQRGDIVGLVGSVGCATGPHVHVGFGVLAEPKKTIDPFGYLDQYPAAFDCTDAWGFDDIDERLHRDKCRWAAE